MFIITILSRGFMVINKENFHLVKGKKIRLNRDEWDRCYFVPYEAVNSMMSGTIFDKIDQVSWDSTWSMNQPELYQWVFVYDMEDFIKEIEEL